MAKPRIKHNTWVVAADGGRALVMCNEGDAEFPRLAVLRTYGEASGQGGPAAPQARSDQGRAARAARIASCESWPATFSRA